MDLGGVFPPVTTPFRDGELDLPSLKRNVDRWLETPLRGIVVLGSNGEAPQLDDEEADRVIGAARERVPKERWLIAGTGRESTRATIAATSRAAALGVDLALVRTPSFFKSRMTTEAFVTHYTAVADASPVPLLLYNFTGVTGVNLQPEAVARLAEHPNIVGIKDSNGDMAQIGEVVASTPADFSVLIGSAPTLLAGLCLGAAGGILALACVVPEQCVRLYRLVGEGQLAEARQLQGQLTPLARLVTSTHGVPGLKAALDLAGYVGGEPRPPLLVSTPQAVDQIRRALRALAVPSPV